MNISMNRTGAFTKCLNSLSYKRAELILAHSLMLTTFDTVLKSLGLYVYITEYYRSSKRQVALYRKNLSKTLKSKHILGLAIDIAIINSKGEFLTDFDTDMYQRMGEWWEAHDGIWGGRWKIGGRYDIYHFEHN